MELESIYFSKKTTTNRQQKASKWWLLPVCCGVGVMISTLWRNKWWWMELLDLGAKSRALHWFSGELSPSLVFSHTTWTQGIWVNCRSMAGHCSWNVFMFIFLSLSPATKKYSNPICATAKRFFLDCTHHSLDLLFYPGRKHMLSTLITHNYF